MPDMRMVTFELTVSCEDCGWETEARMTRREASIGRPSISQVLPEIKQAVGQEYHTCPECGAEALALGDPEIVEETELSTEMQASGVSPSN